MKKKKLKKVVRKIVRRELDERGWLHDEEPTPVRQEGVDEYKYDDEDEDDNEELELTRHEGEEMRAEARSLGVNPDDYYSWRELRDAIEASKKAKPAKAKKVNDVVNEQVNEITNEELVVRIYDWFADLPRGTVMRCPNHLSAAYKYVGWNPEDGAEIVEVDTKRIRSYNCSTLIRLWNFHVKGKRATEFEYLRRALGGFSDGMDHPWPSNDDVYTTPDGEKVRYVVHSHSREHVQIEKEDGAFTIIPIAEFETYKFEG